LIVAEELDQNFGKSIPNLPLFLDKDVSNFANVTKNLKSRDRNLFFEQQLYQNPNEYSPSVPSK
jgi:hypothetical protein